MMHGLTNLNEWWSASTNHTPNNLPRMQNQRLLVQF